MAFYSKTYFLGLKGGSLFRNIKYPGRLNGHILFFSPVVRTGRFLLEIREVCVGEGTAGSSSMCMRAVLRPGHGGWEGNLPLQ